MDHLSRFRGIAVASALLAVLVVGTQPTFAFEVWSQSGSLGSYTVTDTSTKRGANCIYLNSLANPKLTSISVRGPKVFGRLSRSQYVGWSFTIQRQDPLPQDPSQRIWNTIYNSSTVKALATAGHAAVFGRRSWTAGAHPKRQYRVMETIEWFKRGAPTVAEGSVTGRVQWYTAVRGSSTYVEADDCLQSY